MGRGTEPASNPVGSDPGIFLAQDTISGLIKLIASKDDIGTISGTFIVMELPANATTGTFTTAQGVTLVYAEDYDGSDDSVSLAYFSTSATITVTSAGIVGSRWNGTFDADMVDFFPGGGPATTATGSFSVIREQDFAC